MATPMVTGAVALMQQQDATLTPDQIKARLMKTAFKNLVQSATVTDQTTNQTFSEQADIFTVGAGYLDIQAALANTDVAPPMAGSALSPTVTVDANGNVVLVGNSSSVLGGQTILWGTSAVWGETILWGTNVNGETILWGTGSLTSDTILWGTGSLTSDTILWGTSGTLEDALTILWGTNSAQVDASSVLWGSKK
jgi:serine protease AprX